MSWETIDKRTLLGLFVFTLVVHALWVAVSGFPETFVGGDGYVRVLKVEMLWQGTGWFDNSLPRNNAPFGDTTHFTRPLDVLISLLAVPLVPFLEVKAAIFRGGALSGPVLHAAAVAALAWAAAPLVGRTAAVLAGVFVVAQAAIFTYATAMRADHHILFVFLVAAGFGCMVRALGGGASRHAVVAGAIAAAGIWVGIEGLPYAGLCAVTLGLAWVFGADGGVRSGLAFAAAFAAALIGAVLLERGPGDVFTVEYERVSVVHVGLGLLVAVGFGLLRGFDRLRPRSGPVARALAGGACGAAVLVVWHLSFPGFARGPMVDFDPDIVAFIFATNAEYVPGYLPDRFALTLGVPMVAALWTAWRFCRMPPDWPWIHLALCLVFYGAITAAWGRWAIYAALFAVVPLAEMASMAVATIERQGTSRAARITLSALTVGGLLLAPLVAGYAALRAFAPEDKIAQLEAMKSCTPFALTEALRRPPWSDRPRVILAGPNIGGELMYLTPHGVVASHYRKGYEGWRDALEFMRSVDEHEARDLLARRNVELIALCPAFGYEGAGDTLGPKTMYARLITGPTPAGIREVALPPDARAFRLFEVTRVGSGR